MSGIAVVERFLGAMVAHDWGAMAACISEDVERVGPYGDTYRGRGAYVAFIQELLPSLAGYAMRVDRIAGADNAALVTVELTETVEVDGRVVVTPEALVFDLDEFGLIRHIAIYIQRLPDSAGS